MASPEASRRLVVNADDFGRSDAINQAVIRAHRDGILTSASLMVNEAAADDAVALARQNPGLGVGLHLTLVCGRSALPSSAIPNLVNARSQFSNNPAAAGFRYFFSRSCRAQLRDEIAAQFEKFRSFSLPLDHVNGHLHLHLHPTVLKIILYNCERWRVRAVRLTRDPFFLNARIASGRWGYRLSHAIVFGLLSARARGGLARRNIRHTSAVFGLLQNALVNDNYVKELLPLLPPGDSELYSHPSLDQFKNEFDALVNPSNRALVRQLGIQLIRYQDL
jgi:hopanoid biosynthesis associated protein HpnK